MLRITFAFIVAVAALGERSAWAHYCSEPSKPFCLDMGFNSESDFDMCRYEVESFVRSTNEYVRCLNEAGEDAIRKANRAVEQFNCKARRQSFCF